MLSGLGEIKLGCSLSCSLTVSASSPACQAILSIHQYRDLAVSRLRAQADVLLLNKLPASDEDKVTEDLTLQHESLQKKNE